MNAGGMKETLHRVFEQTMHRIALDRQIPRQVSRCAGVLNVRTEQIDLEAFRDIVVVAIGKAAYKMTDIISSILSPYRVAGIVSGPQTQGTQLNGFQCFRAGHPYPNLDSFRAGEAVIEILRNQTEKDLVIYLLSGGGSALCEKPLMEGMTYDDCREFYKLLVTSGINIRDINYVRKHFSAIKGGRLTELAYPARQVTIYISDAPPGNPTNVASGPTMPDESTVEQCRTIIERNNLKDQLPASIRRILDQDRVPETLKVGNKVFQSSTWHCLLAPEDAVEALSQEVRRQGWIVETDCSIDDDCPLERATQHLLDRLKDMQSRHPFKTVAVVTGGEFCCPVKGDGIGGRNQAFVLDCTTGIAGREIAVLSAGTDGMDGVSPAAGAVADGKTLERARELGMNPGHYAGRSDSYGFFSRLGDTIVTGPTSNNLRDLRILVGWQSSVAET